MEDVYRYPKNTYNKSDYSRFVFVMTVGARYTRTAILGVRGLRKYDILLKDTLDSSIITHLPNIINEALREAHEEYHVETSLACISAAGPVTRNRKSIQLTNLDLEVNEEEILTNTMLKRVILLNNFEAMGYGVDFLDIEKDTILLPHVGEDLTAGWKGTSSVALIGAGMGLGMSIAHYDHAKHLRMPMPSEGGHIDFVPYTAEELNFVDYLKKEVLTKKDVHPELERVLSGQGIVTIFTYFSQGQEDDTIKRIHSLQGDAQLIAIEENYENHPVCKKTLDFFFDVFARASRYLGLISECYAGLFIVGKAATANIERLKDPAFMKQFEEHDKRSNVLRKIPVYVVTNDDIDLYGCCNVAVNFYNI